MPIPRNMPIPKSKRPGMLKEIKRQLHQLEVGYNRSTSICECCGTTKYDNFEEFKAAQALRAAVNKVSKVLEIEEGGHWGDDNAV